ncbi:hypothetical protein ABFX02_11G011400 [Erythranthe guttata]
MGRRRKKCRLWWPNNLFSQTPPNSSFLFGWFFPSSEVSLDVVVAFASDEPKITSSMNRRSDLQEILQRINEKMPSLLQDKSKFSLLGYLEGDVSGDSQLVGSGNDKNKSVNSTSDEYQNTCKSNHRSGSRGCSKHDVVLEQCKHVALENMWIELVFGFSETLDGRVIVIPKLDHLHLNSERISHLDLHVIFYEVPTFGLHHYSLATRSSSNLVGSPCKKPKWFDDLHQRDSLPDLDSVIQAINSANAAQVLFHGHRHAEHGLQFFIVCMFSFTWQLFAVFVASLSTAIYVVLQSSSILFSLLSHTYIDVILAKVFHSTVKNIQFRCCQLLYWPIFLQDQSLRSWSSVEFAEKAALHKHLTWSNVLVDVLLGNLFGIPLWFKAEPTWLWVTNFAHDFTNVWLRSGCVWLMGNPAGFKLNTELAGVLGMISLNAIQIWSTLWVFMGFLFPYFTKGLALCGIIFGLTSAAALIVDIISLVTMHVLALHLFLSLLYSTQIQAVSALWRLFRGIKGNPLRHRLDSYDFTVEQHVVGSLLFTPILLLLPTTSAFYIFFTILHTSVSFMCIVVEAAISFIHATTYAKVFLWLKTRKRFPSGVWFEVASCQISDTEAVNGSNSSPGELHKADYGSSTSKSTILVSFLQSNYLNLGEVAWPEYRYLSYSSLSESSIGSSAYGLLVGKSTLYAPGPSFPMKLPWIVIPWKEYWRLCRDSVYACREYPFSNSLQ